MKNFIQFALFIVSIVIFTGCAKIQPVVLLRAEDLLWLPFVYLLLSFALAKFLSFNDNKFWLWFGMCLILTPISGILALIYKLSK